MTKAQYQIVHSYSLRNGAKSISELTSCGTFASRL
jgi:hypothetical protein